MNKFCIAVIILVLNLMCIQRTALITETDTGEITGWVVNKNKESIRDVSVLLRIVNKTDVIVKSSREPADQTNKSVILHDSIKTSPTGYFCFESIPLGDYYLEFNKNDSLGAIVETKLSNDSSISAVDTIMLKNMGSIVGSIDTSLIDNDSNYIYVVELDKKIPVDSMGRFSIINIPSYTYTIRLVENDTIKTSVLDTMAISVDERDITDVSKIGSKQGYVAITGTIREY